MAGKYTKDEQKQILMDCVEAFAELKPKSLIVKELVSNYAMSRVMAYRYIERAFDEFQVSDREDIAKIREFCIRYVKCQLKEAKGSLKVAWFDRYVALFKNSLQPDDDNKKQKLEITYKKVDDE